VSNGAVSIANRLILWDFDIRQLHSALVHLGASGRLPNLIARGAE
jgi:hypothetical protein